MWTPKTIYLTLLLKAVAAKDFDISMTNSQLPDAELPIGTGDFLNEDLEILTIMAAIDKKNIEQQEGKAEEQKVESLLKALAGEQEGSKDIEVEKKLLKKVESILVKLEPETKKESKKLKELEDEVIKDKLELEKEAGASDKTEEEEASEKSQEKVATTNFKSTGGEDAAPATSSVIAKVWIPLMVIAGCVMALALIVHTKRSMNGADNEHQQSKMASTPRESILTL